MLDYGEAAQDSPSWLSAASYDKKLQATKMVQLFRTHDPAVRKAAVLCLTEEKARQRLKFRPAVLSCHKTTPRAAEP